MYGNQRVSEFSNSFYFCKFRSDFFKKLMFLNYLILQKNVYQKLFRNLKNVHNFFLFTKFVHKLEKIVFKKNYKNIVRAYKKYSKSQKQFTVSIIVHIFHKNVLAYCKTMFTFAKKIVFLKMFALFL